MTQTNSLLSRLSMNMGNPIKADVYYFSGDSLVHRQRFPILARPSHILANIVRPPMYRLHVILLILDLILFLVNQ
jgi:hypothetical protein